MAHDSNTNGNHDARGRFTAGNKAGRGNPHHRRVAELRAKMLERVTPDDIAAVVEALVNNGDWDSHPFPRNVPASPLRPARSQTA